MLSSTLSMPNAQAPSAGAVRKAPHLCAGCVLPSLACSSQSHRADSRKREYKQLERSSAVARSIFDGAAARLKRPRRRRPAEGVVCSGRRARVSRALGSP